MATKFFVEGTPAPGGSKSGFYSEKLHRVVIYDAGGKKTKDWKEMVADEARNHFVLPIEKGIPLEILVRFDQRRPKSHYKSDGFTLKPSSPKYPTSKPDATKLLRSTEDALTGIAWRDDAQIIDQHVHKRYAAWDEPEGAHIIINEVKG